MRRPAFLLPAALTSLLLLAACEQNEPRSVAVAPLPDPSEPPPRKVTDQQPRTVAGRYEPLSPNAETVTGAVEVGPDAVTFANGQTYATAAEGLRFSNESYASESESWAGMMQVPEFTLLEVRRVTSARAQAQRGLCGDQSVTFLALAMEPQDGGSDELAIAAFIGDKAPAPDTPPEALCATYRFARE